MTKEAAHHHVTIIHGGELCHHFITKRKDLAQANIDQLAQRIYNQRVSEIEPGLELGDDAGVFVIGWGTDKTMVVDSTDDCKPWNLELHQCTHPGCLIESGHDVESLQVQSLWF